MLYMHVFLVYRTVLQNFNFNLSYSYYTSKLHVQLEVMVSSSGDAPVIIILK
jgi:hypothetical protein